MKLLTRNAAWKLLSLAIAVALWIAVAREPDLSTSLAVPIEFKSVPDDLDIGSNVPERVHIEIHGPSGRITRANVADIAVIVDLSDAQAGERTYNIRSSNINLPAGVTFYRAVPSQITLRFDKLFTREVEIVPAPFSKGPPEGYRVRAFTVTPSRTRIRGPEERVKSIARVALDPVDLSGVVSQAEFHTHVNIGDPQVRLEAPGTVTLKVTLEKGTARETK